MPRFHVSDRARDLIVIILAALFIAVFVTTVLRTRPYIARPFPGFLLLHNNFVPVISLPEWEGVRRGVKVGFIVVAVNGRAVETSEQVWEMVRSVPAGTSLTYTFNHSGKSLDLAVPTSLFTLRDYIIIHAVWMLTGVTYFLTGLIVFYLKPNLKAARAFLVSGLVSCLSQMPAPDYCISNRTILPLVFLQLVGPAVVGLGCYFPAEIKARKYLIAAAGVSVVPLLLGNGYFFSRVLIFIYFDTAVLIHLALTFGLGVVLMVHSFVTSTDALVRQKGKIVIYGLILTILFVGPGLLASLLFKVLNFFWLFIPFAIFPVSVAYAIVKHNLFDVDLLIRRTAGYFAASFLVLAVTIALLNLINYILQTTGGQSAPIASAVTILILVLAFNPLRTRLDRVIERRFFRQKIEYHQAIRQAGRALNQIMDLSRLSPAILDSVMDALPAERGTLVMMETETGALRVAAAREVSPERKDPAGPERKVPAAFSADLPLFRYLERGEKALQLNDLREHAAFRPDREALAGTMEQLQAVLIVPIIYEHKLTGALALGPKSSGAWYSSEDIEVLQTLMIQTAVSIANARKVEELKKLVEVETSLRELQKLDALKDHFLSMVSHDLRTPMTGIMAYAVMMRDQAGELDEPSRRQYLDVIIQQSERLTGLLNDLLDVQRFEAGRMELDFEELDLGGAAAEAAETFAGVCRQKGIVLETLLPDRRVMVGGHRDRLVQVVANLLSNAVKYTPAGGRIRLRVEIAMRESIEEAVVSVTDTGPGIPLEYRDRLFEKFHQVRGGGGGREAGSGLGLALVRHIVEYHGGRVGLESGPNEGSVFYFALPMPAGAGRGPEKGGRRESQGPDC